MHHNASACLLTAFLRRILVPAVSSRQIGLRLLASAEAELKEWVLSLMK